MSGGPPRRPDRPGTPAPPPPRHYLRVRHSSAVVRLTRRPGSLPDVEFFDVARQRRMTRRFAPRPVARDVLDRIVAAATSAPTAGKTGGVELLVLDSAERRALFWELASDRAWRENGRESVGLMAAPVLIVPVADPDAYIARYGRPDKEGTALHGLAAADWPVPYWIVDASFAAMLTLLAAADAGLGALFFQLHAPAETVLAGLGLPPTRVLIGALAIGHPALDPPTI
ncbi:MAG: nitroreductase family protein [Acidimicrobiales bacterium]